MYATGFTRSGPQERKLRRIGMVNGGESDEWREPRSVEDEEDEKKERCVPLTYISSLQLAY